MHLSNWTVAIPLTGTGAGYCSLWRTIMNSQVLETNFLARPIINECGVAVNPFSYVVSIQAFWPYAQECSGLMMVTRDSCSCFFPSFPIFTSTFNCSYGCHQV